MGYFAISLKQDVCSQLQDALKNIELWESLEEGGEYLVSGFVKMQVEMALEAYIKERGGDD